MLIIKFWKWDGPRALRGESWEQRWSVSGACLRNQLSSQLDNHRSGRLTGSCLLNQGPSRESVNHFTRAYHSPHLGKTRADHFSLTKIPKILIPPESPGKLTKDADILGSYPRDSDLIGICNIKSRSGSCVARCPYNFCCYPTHTVSYLEWASYLQPLIFDPPWYLWIGKLYVFLVCDVFQSFLQRKETRR